MTLPVGASAPDFEATASDGRTLHLADLRGKKNVVLYFYPADFTLVCTRETCGFRDIYDELQSKDTEVVGVSFDSDQKHEAFRKEHGVPFPLLADTSHALADKYEATTAVSRLLGRTARVTYVIDKQGKIAGVFQAELRAGTHVEGVRRLLASLG